MVYLLSMEVNSSRKVPTHFYLGKNMRWIVEEVDGMMDIGDAI